MDSVEILDFPHPKPVRHLYGELSHKEGGALTAHYGSESSPSLILGMLAIVMARRGRGHVDIDLRDGGVFQQRPVPRVDTAGQSPTILHPISWASPWLAPRIHQFEVKFDSYGFRSDCPETIGKARRLTRLPKWIMLNLVRVKQSSFLDVSSAPASCIASNMILRY